MCVKYNAYIYIYIYIYIRERTLAHIHTTNELIRLQAKAEKEGFTLGKSSGSFKANSKALAELESTGIAKCLFNKDTGKVLGRRESCNMPQFTRFTSTKVQILTPEDTGKVLGRRESCNMPQFTRFTSTKVQILTPEHTGKVLGRRESCNMPQFTRFTSTTVQILTPEETQGARRAHHRHPRQRLDPGP